MNETADKALYYENYDLDSIKTPVDTDKLQQLLEESQYDKLETEFVCNGFELEYAGPKCIRQKSQNLKLRVGSKLQLWNKVMKEVKLEWYAGLYETIPFEHYIQSPIGLVPKDGGYSTRLIFHLSHLQNPQKGYSVNANTPKDLCSVNYPDFNEAIQLCIEAGVGCKLGKSDMSAAFRNLGMSRHSWPFMILKAESPFDRKTYYFMDKCLPFGVAISCSHFQRVSNAIAHFVQYRSKCKTVNYLDNFLFMVLLRLLCNSQLWVFLDVCDAIHFPVSMEKTYWATTTLTFFGFLHHSGTGIHKVFVCSNCKSEPETTSPCLYQQRNQTWFGNVVEVYKPCISICTAFSWFSQSSTGKCDWLLYWCQWQNWNGRNLY